MRPLNKNAADRKLTGSALAKRILLYVIPVMMIYSCAEIPSGNEVADTESSLRGEQSAGGFVTGGDLVLEVADMDALREELAGSRSKANGSQRLYKQVLVHPKGATPGSHGAPVVDNLADAVARVEAGGTIKVWPGLYEVEEPIIIDRPMTIEARSGEKPVIRNSGLHSFFVDHAAGGTVTFSNLRFENRGGPSHLGGHSSVVADASEVLITGSEFDIEGGYSGVFINMGTQLTVEESTFTGGVLGIFSHAEGTVMNIGSSSFSGHAILGVQYQAGSSGSLTGSTLSDCGQAACARAVSNATVDMLDNTFRETIDETQVDGFFHHVVLYSLANGRVSDNLFDGCGHGQCVTGINSSVLEVSANRFDIYEDQNTRFAVIGSDGTGGVNPVGREVDMTVTDNVITGIGGSFESDPGNGDAYAIKFGGIQVEHLGQMTVHRNTITNANVGITAHDRGVISAGEDNVISNVRTAVAVYDLGISTAILHRNDFSGYHVAFTGSTDSGSSSLTCNWWGSSAGPQNTEGGTTSLWTPWATASVAGTGATSCTGGM